MKHQNPGYAAMIKSHDENVGRVLDHLHSRGLADNTIVIFTSDNGGHDGRRVLINLHEDTKEARDLAPSQPNKLAGLSRQLAAWRTEVDAKLPQPNPAYRGK